MRLRESSAGDNKSVNVNLARGWMWRGDNAKNVMADEVYDIEDNYSYRNQNQKTAYVKDNRFHYEQKRNYKKKQPYRAENFAYSPEVDEYECPQKKRLRYVNTKPYKSENGYISERRIYECEDCSHCPVKAECTRAKNNRQIQIGKEWERLKQQARDNLLSPQGLVLRSRRPVEVAVSYTHLTLPTIYSV